MQNFVVEFTLSNHFLRQSVEKLFADIIVYNMTTEMFKARIADPIIQEFIANIPEEMRNLVFPFYRCKCMKTDLTIKDRSIFSFD